MPKRAREARARGEWCRSSTTSTRTLPSRRTWSSMRATSDHSRDISARIPPLLDFAGPARGASAAPDQYSLGRHEAPPHAGARALVNDPQLVFMDEPTTGLDPQARHLIWERLRSLTRKARRPSPPLRIIWKKRSDSQLARDHGCGRIIARGLAARPDPAEHIELQWSRCTAWVMANGWRARRPLPRASGWALQLCYAGNGEPLLKSFRRTELLPAPAGRASKRCFQAYRSRSQD